MRRILLFLATNAVVLVTISAILSLTGLGEAAAAAGVNHRILLIVCAVWGIGGAFVSLAFSRRVAMRFYRIKLIDPGLDGVVGRELLAMVEDLSARAGLTRAPQVGVYDSHTPNAFATGPSKSRSLVAVSTGLLSSMNRDEVRGVLAHEIAHVANGDMVTMALVQGVVNAFTLFFARVLAFAITSVLRSRWGRPSWIVRVLLVSVFDIIFGLLGSIVVCIFSRFREYRADDGGATLAGRDAMISALSALKRSNYASTPERADARFSALKISTDGRLFGLLSTHPPLDERIRRLRGVA